MTQSQIAKKAVRTRKARDNFFNKFGATTYYVVESLLSGRVEDACIALSFGISSGSLRAIKANLTRNTYAPFVTSNGKGTAKL
jgi:hypothetical protein